jgi:LysR family glycine cleavage system transcriptional activator
MAPSTHLGALQALELAVRLGSLKAAAAELHVTPAAVGQRIKLLEDYLGVDLLVRGRSGIRPTSELEAALAHLVAAFRELDTTTRVLDFQRVHEIHIVADTDCAELWLKPRLARFREVNPNTRFCINGVGDVPVRLGQSDCEIWFGAPRGGAVEDALFRDYLLPVGSAENTSRISAKPPGGELEGFPLLHLDCYRADPDAIGWPEWVARYGGRSTGHGRGMRYRTVVNALEAVYSNAGFIVCGLALVETLADEGRVSLPFPVARGAWTGQGYRVGFRETALRRTQTAEFRNWILAEASRTECELRNRVDGCREA